MDPSVSDFDPHGDPETTAAQAVTLLAAGESESLADLDRIRDWIAADPTHREAFDRARRAWAASAQIIADHREPSAPIEAPSFPGCVFTLRNASLSCVILLCCVLLALLYPERGLLRTGPGEVRRIDLPDGTVAWLDGRSAIRIAYGVDRRRVELVRGRASLKIHSDPQRPFEVDADGARIRDIGTEFCIDRTPDGANVIVAEGSVSVAAGGGAVTLGVGESSHWHNGASPTSAAGADAEGALAWRRGKLVFDRVSLQDALSEVARHRHASLWLLDSQAAGRAVSGVVFTARIEEGLDTLAAAGGVRVLRLPFLTIVFGV